MKEQLSNKLLGEGGRSTGHAGHRTLPGRAGRSAQTEVPASFKPFYQHDLLERAANDGSRAALSPRCLTDSDAAPVSSVGQYRAVLSCIAAWFIAARCSLSTRCSCRGRSRCWTTAEELIGRRLPAGFAGDAHPGQPWARAVCVLHGGDHWHSDRSDDGPLADLQCDSRSVRAVSAAAAKAGTDPVGGGLVRHRRGVEVRADLSVDVSDDRRQRRRRRDERAAKVAFALRNRSA